MQADKRCKDCHRGVLEHRSGDLWACRRCGAKWYRNFHGKMLPVKE
jgi:ribosomal protein L37AE/L43A